MRFHLESASLRPGQIRAGRSAIPGRKSKPAWRDGADPWLSKSESVAYTGRSARTIERAVAAGELEAGGTPGKRAFRRSALDAWLALGVLLMLFVLVLALLELVTG
jgi:hypothetical protein